jgi:hypothetical protein
VKTSALLTAMLLSMAGGASAQTVYRCGPEGRSYSQQPCVDGRVVEVADARSDLERREGEAAASRQSRLARTMERERLEAHSKLPRAVRFNRPSDPQADRSKASGARKDFRAVGPAKKKRVAKAA